MTAKEQKKAAADFATKWADKGYEKGECQKFWRGLLHDVFGVAEPDDWVQYEVSVATGFVDAYIGRTKVLIEQKGIEHSLADKAAMKQAMMYVGAMPDTMPVRYIVLSNFREFWSGGEGLTPMVELRWWSSGMSEFVTRTPRLQRRGSDR